jgi:hypothetical protein
MKTVSLVLALVGVAKASTIVGTYGDGNLADDTVGAVVVGGDQNTASGTYSTIGGGYLNRARGDYAVISGGEQNTVISNYGAIMGGYKNHVSGRFGTVLGGSKNTAAGRHSTVMGFSATTTGDYSMTACFTGDECVTDMDNTISFFSDYFYINDIEVTEVLGAAKRMLSESPADNIAKANELISDYTEEYEAMVAEVEAALAQQDALIESFNSKLH